MRFCLVVVSGLVVLFSLAGCRGCIAQHDPRADWKKFETESTQANKKQPMLAEDGSIPPALVAENTGSGDPIEEKYQLFCASCHGAQGKGDGAAGAALKPKPKNFVTWNDATRNDDYIAKIIAEGGAAVGKSPAMAAWGGVLSPDEIKGMVAKVKSFNP